MVHLDSPHSVMQYFGPRWLPGGNLQTIWASLYARRRFGPHILYRRERWNTPDADFVDVDWLANSAGDPLAATHWSSGQQPLLVLFHGLEGSSRSHYAEAFADFARQHGMAYAVPHFRGCSGEPNWTSRAYHSGDYEEIGWLLQQFRVRHAGPILAVGVSLGGNALLRWAEEAGSSATACVSAVAAVCAPLDLAAGGHAIGRGFNRMVYARMFLKTLVPKAMHKLAQHPGLFDGEALRQVRTLYEFDNLYTAPVHGFKNTEDYWARASAKPHLSAVRVPALVVNARNDPFIPAWSLPTEGDVGPFVRLWQPHHGGHVGFPHGKMPGHVRAMPETVGHWLSQHLT